MEYSRVGQGKTVHGRVAQGLEAKRRRDFGVNSLKLSVCCQRWWLSEFSCSVVGDKSR